MMQQPPVEEVAQPERQEPPVDNVVPPAREQPIIIDIGDYKQYTMSHDEFKHACRAVTADGKVPKEKGDYQIYKKAKGLKE